MDEKNKVNHAPGMDAWNPSWRKMKTPVGSMFSPMESMLLDELPGQFRVPAGPDEAKSALQHLQAAYEKLGRQLDHLPGDRETHSLVLSRAYSSLKNYLEVRAGYSSL